MINRIIVALTFVVLLNASMLLGVLPASSIPGASPVALALTSQDCLSCHTENISNRHHDLGLDCFGCHEMIWNSATSSYTMTVTTDCTVCHSNISHEVLHEVVPNDCTQCHQTNLFPIHLDNCALCHNSTDPVVQAAILVNDTNCITCHTSTNHQVLHEVVSNDCTACHQPNLWDTHLQNCSLCHDSTDPTVQNAIATNDTSCYTCHASVWHQTLHDVTANDCTQCHQSNLFDVHASNCTLCHDSTDPTVQNAIATNDTSCYTCHASVWHQTLHDVTANDCTQCHQSNLFDVHASNCVLCHESTDPAVSGAIAANNTDCSACHANADHRTLHEVNPNDCTQCHQSNLFDVHASNCTLCHDSVDPAVQAAIATNNTDCAACHSSVDHRMQHEVANSDCLSCHESNLQDVHTAGCAQCHESTDPTVLAAIATNTTDCSACHISSHAESCGLCHNGRSMADYAGQGKSIHSRHRDKVTCGVCHAVPDTVDIGSSNNACAGLCHDGESYSSARSVHQRHADKFGMVPNQCYWCHGKSGVPARPSNICSLCHSNESPNADKAHSKHADRFECLVCHETVDNLGVDVRMDASRDTCNVCHSPKSGDAWTVHDLHVLPNSDADQAQCYACHGSADVYSASQGDKDCSRCHGSESGAYYDIHYRHAGQAMMCAVCHANMAVDVSGVAPLPVATHDLTDNDCTACHQANLLEVHTNDCGLCHVSTDPVVQAAISTQDKQCATCHVTDGHAAMHDSPTGDCTACHQANLYDVHNSDCTLCHDSTDPSVMDAIATNNTSCTACHDSTGHRVVHEVPLNDCTDCHATNLYDVHLENCSMCHDSVDPGVQNAIATMDTSCYTCHDSVWHQATHDVPSNNCTSCHQSNLFGDHASNCTLCHDSANPVVQNAILSNDTSCYTCHASTYHQAYHEDAPSDCTSCHQTNLVDVHLSNCAACHESVDPVVQDAIAANNVSCVACHSSVDHALLHETQPNDCSQCHQTHLYDVHSSNCALCHDSTDPTVQNAVATNDTSCYTCHGNDGHRTQHDVLANDCTSCHQSNLFDVHSSNCALCHESTDPTVLNAIAANDTSCYTCHASVWHQAQHDVVASDCTTCHQSNLFDVHSSNCLLCHQSTNPTVQNAITTANTDCSACHASVDHRSMHEVANNDCVACHETNLQDVHTDNCGLCHDSTDPAVQSAIGNHNKDCSACHSSSHAESCALCHSGRDMADYAGQGKSVHSRHRDKVTCGVCHAVPDTVDIGSSNNACAGLCHDGESYSSARSVHQRHADKFGMVPNQCYWCHGKTGVPARPSNICSLCHKDENPSASEAHSRHADMLECTVCHETVANLYPDVRNDSSRQACTVCHSPESGSAQSVHDKHVLGSYEEDWAQCYACHGAGNVYAATQGDKNCSSCHGSENSSFTSVHYRHAGRAVMCAVCHSNVSPDVQGIDGM